jgi:hypothetical protein
MPTAIEIATMRGAPITLGVLRLVQTAVPLFSAFDVRAVKKTEFKTLVIDGLPDVDPFVNLGEGFLPGLVTMSLRKFSCSYLGGLVKVQVDVANEWQAENEDLDYDYFTLQASERIKADLVKVQKQMIYGTASGSAKGFPGLKQMTPGLGKVDSNVLAMTDTPQDTDFAKSVINAGGSTANTASSAYGIVFGPLNCQLVMGATSDQGNELFNFGERVEQMIAPDPTNAPLALAKHELAQYSGHIGLSIGGFSESDHAKVKTQHAVRRVSNLTNQTDCGMDDFVMEKLLNSFPEGQVPNIWTMSHRSGEQWAKSRKSTGSVTFVGNMGSGRDGTINRAPQQPNEYAGIPVVYTKAILNSEAIEAAA